ncbi:MAG: type II toxin-antitoxin system HicA family toxin [Rhodospirillaceae bacterium]|nr:type II toxin-antitoxin system HicA family toxin [Rhodospirillaceae bacterium]MYB11749.1 type II toxin-antitoxin system HicA family toxin [Rhodospirillaceae bacterium]MYI47867.1 type II toxin-antitoxin system HicA family toxin [Rhodospirillaceae bacterium]
MATYEREVKRLLVEAGWGRVRQSAGSHEQWQHPGDRSPKTITVPSKIKSRHTANNILKSAGLQKAF